MIQPDKQKPVTQIRVYLKLYTDESFGETSIKHSHWVFRPFLKKNFISLLPGHLLKADLNFINLLRHWLTLAKWYENLFRLCSVSPLWSQSSEIGLLVMIARCRIGHSLKTDLIFMNLLRHWLTLVNWVDRPFFKKSPNSYLPGHSLKTDLIFMNLLRHWLTLVNWVDRPFFKKSPNSYLTGHSLKTDLIFMNLLRHWLTLVNWVDRPFFKKSLMSLIPGHSLKTDLIFMNLLRHWLTLSKW